MINTFSAFYYGIEIGVFNKFVCFSEDGGSSEIVAELSQGNFTPTDFAQNVEDALNDVGSNGYSVTFNRQTRLITISSNSDFILLFGTGTAVESDISEVAGFASVDTNDADTHTGTLPCGKAFYPQMKFQDYMPLDKNARYIDPSINRSSTGLIEVVSYGLERFMRFRLPLVTNIPQNASGLFINNPNAVEETRDFLDWCIKKAKIEFMADRNDALEFDNLILESTSVSQTGTGYELIELFSRGLAGYYDTGILNFRQA